MMVASVWLISPFKGVIFFFIEVVWRNSLRREKTLSQVLVLTHQLLHTLDQMCHVLFECSYS